jgi:hypothetical protein
MVGLDFRKRRSSGLYFPFAQLGRSRKATHAILINIDAEQKRNGKSLVIAKLYAGQAFVQVRRRAYAG